MLRTERYKYIVTVDEPTVRTRGRQYVPAEPRIQELYDLLADPTTPPIPTPVLIFGGGYNGDDAGDRSGDLGKDARPAGGAGDVVGVQGQALGGAGRGAVRGRSADRAWPAPVAPRRSLSGPFERPRAAAAWALVKIEGPSDRALQSLATVVGRVNVDAG